MDNTPIANAKADCVIIDSNIWRSDLLLKTPIAISLVYTLGRQNGFIGLPEIVEGELKRQVLEVGNEAAQSLNKSWRIINALIDSSFDPPVVTDAILIEKLTDRIGQLHPLLVRVPFTLEHAKAALEMVNARLAPNGKSDQQFKDSAIWRAVLELALEYRVHFVTDDRAFLCDKNDPSKGLALNLQEECNNLGVRVGNYCKLSDCLKAIRDDAPTVDKSRLRSLILPAVEGPLHSEAKRIHLLIGDVSHSDIEAFRGAKADRLAVDYSITTSCEQDSSFSKDSRTNIRAIVHGSCYYNPVADSLSDNFIQYVKFDWNYAEGGHGSNSRSYAGDNVPISFRRPIKWN